MAVDAGLGDLYEFMNQPAQQVLAAPHARDDEGLLHPGLRHDGYGSSVSESQEPRYEPTTPTSPSRPRWLCIRCDSGSFH